MSRLRKVDHRLFCVESTAPVRQALEKINSQSGRPCLIVDDAGRCLGIVTDGDIRRFLLDGKSLDESLTSLATDFYWIDEDASAEDAEKRLRSDRIQHLPVLDSRKRVVGIWVEQSQNEPRENVGPVLILAGGKGARLHPLTLSRPKPLIKVGDITLLDRALEKCVSDGFRTFYLSVNYLKDQVIDHLGELDSSTHSITFVEEDSPLGTAGPVGLLPPESHGDLLVVNADVIHNVDLGKMMEAHQESGAAMTVAVRLHQTTIPFGVVEVEGTQIVRVTEKPTLNFPVNAGMYVLSQTVRDMVPPGVALDMPDLIEMAIAEGLTVSSFLAHEYWLDVGTHESLALAESEIDQWNLGSS
jgi:dTDP-glucose pyrophosphorylase